MSKSKSVLWAVQLGRPFFSSPHGAGAVVVHYAFVDSDYDHADVGHSSSDGEPMYEKEIEYRFEIRYVKKNSHDVLRVKCVAFKDEMLINAKYADGVKGFDLKIDARDYLEDNEVKLKNLVKVVKAQIQASC